MKKLLVPIFALLTISAYGQLNPAVVTLTAEKLHARVREWPYPVNGITVPSCTPSLLWPATNGKSVVLPMESGSDLPEDPNIGNIAYKILLASDSTFSRDVIAGAPQRWAVYPLHQALKPGRWYWKYAYSLKGGQWVWSPVYDFVVEAKTATIVPPPVQEVLERNQAPHPRLWNMSKIGEVFYHNNLENPEAKLFITHAEKLMREPLPAEQPMRVIDTTGKTSLEKKKIIERMYHGFGDKVGTPVRNLCIAYQLTKDERFIQDARRRALNIARMDPNGLATGDDFTSGAVLEALGWFYDAGYKTLSNDEKALLEQVIRIRAKRVYDHLPNRFELHVSDNHVWQITLRNLAIATVAVSTEIPEAREWLSYMYEVWTARFPILGTTDGGWHEGNGYFRVNYKSFIYLSQLFSDFSGVNYFNLPWMQQLPYYMIYTYPPRSASTATGDMWENIPHMVKGQAWFADALTYKINNPYLNWYVAEIRKDHPDFFRGTDDYLFFRLLNYDPNRKPVVMAPQELPKSRKFADVGVVAMHEDLGRDSGELSSYLLSSPFGSSGHGHASQNAITVNFKGKTIFGGSGYYSNFSDRHNLLDYRTSKAYCTILADSLSQKLGEEGYGWIPRAISGRHLQYALGDASNAYGDIASSFWLDRFSQINITPDKSNGYGDPGVKLFRRHLLQLAGGIIIMYDELEAKQPVKWTTQFHTPYYTIVPGESTGNNQQHFTVANDVGNVAVSVITNTPSALVVHDKFAEPAVNWAKVTDDDGKIKDFTLQSHAGITSSPAKLFRFLTIMQVKNGQPERVKVVATGSGFYQCDLGGWYIQAQLDGDKPPAIQVSSKQDSTFFNYGSLPIRFAGKTYAPKIAASTMLLEITGDKVKQIEVTDELPDVLEYDPAPYRQK
ncbi:DUF4962 domain-containing protein [Chitinophaga sp. RAB17]|uniref:DUF4962 domain-containing protein n=1 Tax=Chitinophaga sp. RAB17 TaxID=3233049 RepID=UPI003F8E87BE